MPVVLAAPPAHADVFVYDDARSGVLLTDMPRSGARPARAAAEPGPVASAAGLGRLLTVRKAAATQAADASSRLPAASPRENPSRDD